MKNERPWAIRVDNLTKRYRLGGAGQSNLRQTIAQSVRRIPQALRGESEPRPEDFWALNGVSFEVARGEIVGVLGHNGAGKSTLLKILSQITEPTAGEVRFRGQVGSLLEVGTGFHPELSGRDNIFLNGAILGMSRRHITRRFDEIVEFAEIAPFIDTPVKRYSSGMYTRLAFAVAAHLETDILLVDEVLAVGDVTFQQRCLARMGDLAHDGRTVLFVSHNIAAIQALCPRSILLQRGQVAADGRTNDIVADYLRSRKSETPPHVRRWEFGDGPSGGAARLISAQIIPGDSPHAALIDCTMPFKIAFEYEWSGAPNEPLRFEIKLVNSDNVVVFDICPPEAMWRHHAQGTNCISCNIPADLLNSSEYRVSLTLRRNDQEVLQAPDILTFDLHDSGRDRYGWFGTWEGVLRPRFHWETATVPGPTIRSDATEA